MPTVLIVDGFRFFFWSNEGQEPMHIHVEHGDGAAKFWLNPVSLASNYGMKPKQLKVAEALTTEHQETFRSAWREYFK